MDDEQSLGDDAGVGRGLVSRVGELRLSFEALAHDLLGGSLLEHALTACVVGSVAALEQVLKIPVAVDRDA